jgi:hypothetical protein
MAAADAKALADGQVASTKGTIYTAPADTTIIIPKEGLSLKNITANQQTGVVYVNRSGTSREIGSFVLDEDYVWTNPQTFTLEDGDLLEAETTNAASIEFVLSGAQEV